MKKKTNQISYPSRIEADLVERVNRRRKRDAVSWPELTRQLLHLYLFDKVKILIKK